LLLDSSQQLYRGMSQLQKRIGLESIYTDRHFSKVIKTFNKSIIMKEENVPIRRLFLNSPDREQTGIPTLHLIKELP